METREKRTCIFCGATPVTREHVFGDKWMERLYGPGRYDVFRETLNAGSSEPANRKKFETVGAQIVVKCACGPCNHGWMARLDDAAHPLVEPLALGNFVVLNKAQTQIVAAWATKISMCLASTTTEGRLPLPEIASAFRERGEIPTSQRVRIARAHNIPWPDTWAMTVQVLPKEDIDPAGNEGYTATFRINHVVLQVFMPPPGLEHEQGAKRWDRFATAIWPTVQPIVWRYSAERALDAIDLNDFGRAYFKPI